MSRCTLFASMILCLLLAIQFGCGPVDSSEGETSGGSSTSETSSDDSGESTSSTAVPKSVGDTSNLPAVEPPFLSLDGGRVEIGFPAGWKPLSRNSKYLIWFSTTARKEPPLIFVTVEESADEKLTTIDADNASAFEALIKQEVEGKLLDEEELVRPVSTVTLGGRPWVEHCRYGKVPGKKTIIQRLFLQTVVKSRRYQVELWVYSGELSKHEKAAYSIASAMKFVDSNEAAPAGGLGGELGEATE